MTLLQKKTPFSYCNYSIIQNKHWTMLINLWVLFSKGYIFFIKFERNIAFILMLLSKCQNKWEIFSNLLENLNFKVEFKGVIICFCISVFFSVSCCSVALSQENAKEIFTWKILLYMFIPEIMFILDHRVNLFCAA